jgi:hypothetical protein
VTLAIAPATAVASNLTGVSPATVAVTWFAPGDGPILQRVLEVPLLSVAVVFGATVPPPAVTAHVIVAPVIGLAPESVTRTVGAAGNSVSAVPLCPLPDTIAMLAGGPATAVASNVAGASTPTVAVTLFAPSVSPSAQLVAARPALSVKLVAGVTVPLPATTAQLTDAPTTARSELSLTETLSTTGNAAPAAPVWLLPDTIVMETASGGVS